MLHKWNLDSSFLDIDMIRPLFFMFSSIRFPYAIGISGFVNSHSSLSACRHWESISQQIFKSLMKHCQQSLPVHSTSLAKWAVELTSVKGRFSTLFQFWVLGDLQLRWTIYLPVSFMPGNFSSGHAKTIRYVKKYKLARTSKIWKHNISYNYSMSTPLFTGICFCSIIILIIWIIC